MTPRTRSVGRGPAGRRYLGSERERWISVGVCFWFRLFNVVPETTARFSYLDDRSRNQSPPCNGTPLIDLIRPPILRGRSHVDRRSLKGRFYSPFQRPLSLVARAASRSASRAMITLRLS